MVLKSNLFEDELHKATLHSIAHHDYSVKKMLSDQRACQWGQDKQTYIENSHCDSLLFIFDESDKFATKKYFLNKYFKSKLARLL